MILLSVGTHRQPFPRALDLIEPLARQGTEVIVQYGSTKPRPDMPNATWVELMAFDELVDTMERVDNVVCHAGVGTIMTALQRGHTPVVIPRQARHGEHVDDHQLEIANRFVERGLIRSVTSETDLTPLLVPRGDTTNRGIGKGSPELRAAVSKAVAAGPSRGRFALQIR